MQHLPKQNRVFCFYENKYMYNVILRTYCGIIKKIKVQIFVECLLFHSLWRCKFMDYHTSFINEYNVSYSFMIWVNWVIRIYTNKIQGNYATIYSNDSAFWHNNFMQKELSTIPQRDLKEIDLEGLRCPKNPWKWSHRAWIQWIQQ